MVEFKPVSTVFVFCVYYSALLGPCDTCPQSGIIHHSNTGFGDICYWLIVTFQSADASEALCNQQGGRLAYIPDQPALDSVIQMKDDAGYMFGGEFFIGYTVKGNVITIRGTNIVQTFNNWRSGQPSSIADECVSIYNRYADWYNEACTTKYKAVCSINFTSEEETTTILPATTTTTTTTPTTTSTTTTEPSTTTTIASTTQKETTSTEKCCSCVYYNSTKTITEFKEEVKNTLSVDKATLSSSIRKKTSASDPRPSSAGIGFVGILIMTLVFGTIIVMDSSRMFAAGAKCYKSKMKRLKHSKLTPTSTTYTGIGSV